MLSASDFFDLDKTQHSALFADTVYVWDAIKHIGDYVRELLATEYPPNSNTVNLHPSVVIEGDVHIGEGTVIAPHVYIQGPVVIGKNC